MGQRLNIEIKNNEKVLANCYYHWSGYTISSLILTKQIINFIESNEVPINVNGAIRVLQETGASFNEQAWIKAKEMGIVSGEYEECKGRNDGLIAVDKENMKETRDWEEGRIEINIENRTFNFNCAWEKDYIDDEDIWEKMSSMFYKIEYIERSWEIPFNQIDVLFEGVQKAQDEFKGRFYFGYSCYSSIY